MVKSAGPRLLVILFAVNCLVYGTGLSYTVGYPGNGADLSRDLNIAANGTGLEDASIRLKVVSGSTIVQHGVTMIDSTGMWVHEMDPPGMANQWPLGDHQYRLYEITTLGETLKVTKDIEFIE